MTADMNPDVDTDRTCSRCGQTKPIAEFPLRSDGRRRHSWCRPCKVAYDREWYARNREAHIARVRVATDRARARNADILAAAKDRPCEDCGLRWPAWVLEFDHVRGEKRNDVSKLAAWGAAAETLRAEIAKCEVVCANCHRERTHRRRVERASSGVGGSVAPDEGDPAWWVAGDSNPERTD